MTVTNEEEPKLPNKLENYDMPKNTDDSSPPLTCSQLIQDQQADPELVIPSQEAITEEEAQDNPVCYFKRDGVLIRKWRPPSAPAIDDWKVVYQIVVLRNCHRDVLELAHSTPMAGHLGVNKMYSWIQNHFYWPGIKRDIQQFCRSCHVCQLVGKPNQKVPVAPLQPIPAVEEPFSRVIVDCVGPLPKTKAGNLTVMCASTRFPEAIPLRNIKAKNIVKALIKFLPR